MGDLTAQLAELNKLRNDEAEYDHNRQAVAGFRLNTWRAPKGESRAIFTGPAPNGGAR